MTTQKNFIFQYVAVFALLSFLTGCGGATTPQGPDAEGMTHIADQLRAKGDDGGAADFYQRVLLITPDDQHARIALAEILTAHGDNAAAAAQYKQALAQDPDNGDDMRALAGIYLRMNRPADARNMYEKALKEDSSDAKAMNGLGIALDYLGQHEAAQKSYKDALNENPNDLAVMNNLAHSYVLTGDYNGAIKLLEPHTKDKAATPALRQNLAEAYGMAGMDADAERVGLMDLTQDEVKHNLAYYRARRDQLSLTPKLYADLGSFPTEAVADSTVQRLKLALPKETAGVIVKTEAGVGAIGGTPSFDVKAFGFANAAKLKSFCDKARKEGLNCKPHGL